MKKLLSIHMLVKNGAKTIERAIEPFVGIADEIVFTDTGSTDGTPSLIKNFGEKHNIATNGVLINEQTHPSLFFDFLSNGNPMWFLRDWSAARNLSLQLCEGSYVVKMDVDDQLISDPSNILKILNHLEENPKIDFVMCPYSVATFPRVEEVPVEYTTMYTRFWRNKPEIRFRELIHENVDWMRNSSNYLMTNDSCLVVDRRDAVKERDNFRNYRVLQSVRNGEESKHVLLYRLEEAANLEIYIVALDTSDALLEREDLTASDLSLVWLYRGMALEASSRFEKDINIHLRHLGATGSFRQNREKKIFEAMEAYSTSASYGNGRGILNVARLNCLLNLDGWRDKLKSALSVCQSKLYPFGASNLEVYYAQKMLTKEQQ